jgi:hypothetical protein
MPPRPRMPVHDPRSELDELDFTSTHRPPTGEEWAAVPVTIGDLVKFAQVITGVRTELVTVRGQVKVLEDWHEADRSGELEQAKRRVVELEAEQKRKDDNQKQADLDALIEKTRTRNARIWNFVFMILGGAQGVFFSWLAKRC